MTPIISWKGTTLSQLSSVNKYNIGTNPSPFGPHPVKLYRRERHATSSNRTNKTVASMEQPGATVVNSAADGGACGIVDIHLTERTDERPGSCTSCTTLNFSAEGDARRRVRSSGMNSRNFLSSTKQYLDSRIKSYDRNQYYYIRQGDETAIAGTAAATNNVYSSNGCSNCPRHTFATDVTFEYQWIDSNYFTVTVPAGDYSDDDFNAVFKNTMIANYHYVVRTSNQSKVLLLNISHNVTSGKIEIATTATDNTIFDTVNYERPKDQDGNEITAWTIPPNTVLPGVKFLAGEVADALGFVAGTYPLVPIGSINTQDLNTTTFFSTSSPTITSQYVPLYYKPNNYQYGQQGAVDSSSRIARLKYNVITDSAATYTTALGRAVANALAYGVPEGGYTIKDKIGYPLKCTPVAAGGEMRTCPPKSFRNMI